MDILDMQKTDTSNTLFTLATELVNHTSRSLFLTGKAGTGKTTFLKYIREHCPKQMAVVAPTGVAAINAGGVTIHSFFQLPLSPFIPESRGFTANGEDANNKHTLLGRLRFNSDRRKVLQELELLIIDEISMVRCDVLDAIDLVLRHVRNRQSEPFGGVQLLFIGDLFQLPPVVKEDEWKLLGEYYQSPFFFDSLVIKEQPPLFIEFTKIYRQNEENFIRLLNKVRNNEMDEASLEQLHQRYQPDFFGNKDDGYILLTTHNEKAAQINAQELNRLKGEVFVYEAKLDGDFPPTAFPVEKQLQLKLGAQVMFLKNDVERGKRFFNGKIGTVASLSKEKIEVLCKGETEPIEVPLERWENIRYTLDKSTRSLNEEVMGSFAQFPLRLAWAITIHKSQGLTFEKAVIDAGKAFAPGQVYVALSRCTSLQGMVLHSKLQTHSLFTDSRIVRFTQQMLSAQRLESDLAIAKKEYQQKLLLQLFDFAKPLTAVKEVQAYVTQHATSFNVESLPWLDALLGKLNELQQTGEKFQTQLNSLFTQASTIDTNTALHERLSKAVVWFAQKIKTTTEHLQQSPAVTDSGMHAKEYNEWLRDAFAQLSLQQHLLQSIDGRFDSNRYQQLKKSFTVPSFGVNSYAGATDRKVELAHPVLFYQLKKIRDSICAKKNLPIYYVASSKTLEEMATYLPQTVAELQEISGFGPAKAGSYGEQFLEAIQAYAAERNLPSTIADKSGKRKRKEKATSTTTEKKDTKSESLRLYQEGKTVGEIAAERKLSVQTIEGHLAHFLTNGTIDINGLVSREKMVLIEPAAKGLEKGSSMTALKERLPDSVSYGEIRLVLAWMEGQESTTHVNH